MRNIQVSVRVPPHLYEKLIAHTQSAKLSKSEVMARALANYLGDAEEIPPNHQIAELEKRVSALEAQSDPINLSDSLQPKVTAKPLFEAQEATQTRETDWRGSEPANGKLAIETTTHPLVSPQAELAQFPLKSRTATAIASPIVPPTKQYEFDAITVNAKGEKIEQTQHQSQYFSEDLDEGIALEMVYIPDGSFVMGSPKEEKGSRDWERPQHQVTLEPFFLGKFLVTQAQWTAVAKLPKVKRDLKSDPSFFKGDNRPVERVSWYDAVEFCDRLSLTTRRHYHLPSEAQWEYACRARTQTPFYLGETITGDLANYVARRIYTEEASGEYRKETTEVGSFPPNAFGLYDLHGNLWEWCADHWHDNYEDAPTDGSAWLSNQADNYRLLRGGAWDYEPEHCRCAYRHYYNPLVSLLPLIGFRVACRVA